MTDTTPKPDEAVATTPSADTAPRPAPLALQQEEPKTGLSAGTKIGAVIGALVGLPASYWMQNEMLRAKVNVFQYTMGIFTESEAFVQNGFYGPVAMGVLGCAVLGAVIGSKISK